MATLHTLPGLYQGDPLPNPVTPPKPGRQSVPAIVAPEADGKLRNADAESHALYSDAKPVYLSPVAKDAPPDRPAGVPDRPARLPRLNLGSLRDWLTMNPHDNPGTHGELSPGANTPTGPVMQPGVSERRNTFRLPPQPWDTAYYVTPQEEDR